MTLNNLNSNHILGYFALNKIEGDKHSEDFLKKLIDIHGSESEQIDLIINYRINNNINANENFDLLREILKLK